MGVCTTHLDERGYGLCCVCRKKFFISDLYLCDCCDKFVCTTHKKKYKNLNICLSCYTLQKKSK